MRSTKSLMVLALGLLAPMLGAQLSAPIQGVPPVTLYAVALGFLPSAPAPVLRTLPVSYAVP
jgi:hypothetical protein